MWGVMWLVGMGYKINHYARPVDSKATFGWESILKDLTLGLASTAMCYFGFETGVAQLAFSMGLVAFMFYISLLITLIGEFRDYRHQVKKLELEAIKKEEDG